MGAEYFFISPMIFFAVLKVTFLKILGVYEVYKKRCEISTSEVDHKFSEENPPIFSVFLKMHEILSLDGL